MGVILGVIALLSTMSIITFISGISPGAFNNTRLVNLFGILGCGFLIGSAILIVLPESIKALVDANYSTDSSEPFTEAMIIQVGLSVLTGFFTMVIVNELFSAKIDAIHKNYYDSAEQ